MTPEAVANILVNKFYNLRAWETYDADKRKIEYDIAKKAAIICVEQTIDAVEAFGYSLTAYDDFETGKMTHADDNNPTDYWRKVLEHLQKS